MTDFRWQKRTAIKIRNIFKFVFRNIIFDPKINEDRKRV